MWKPCLSQAAWFGLPGGGWVQFFASNRMPSFQLAVDRIVRDYPDAAFVSWSGRVPLWPVTFEERRENQIDMDLFRREVREQGRARGKPRNPPVQPDRMPIP